MTSTRRGGTLDIDVSTPIQLKGEGLTDEDRLMAEVQAGSAEAFSELYDRYCYRAYRVAWSICRDDARAEDAVQEAFTSIWKSRAYYLSQRGTVAAWLLTAVRYRAIDVVRRERKHADRRAGEEGLYAHSAPGNIAEEAVARENTHRLQKLLAQLPDAQQEVITLAYYGQLTHTEIATTLGLPAGTVKGRMRLGLGKLRAGIEKEVA
jgi:RNA polymerase sigma-70 factor (ECF subfamily)